MDNAIIIIPKSSQLQTEKKSTSPEYGICMPQIFPKCSQLLRLKSVILPNINFFCTWNARSLSSYSQYDPTFSLDICSTNCWVTQFQLLAPICHFSYRPVVNSGRGQTAIHNMADLTSVVFGSSSSSSRHAVVVVVYWCRRPFRSERVITVSQYPHTTVFTVCGGRHTARRMDSTDRHRSLRSLGAAR